LNNSVFFHYLQHYKQLGGDKQSDEMDKEEKWYFFRETSSTQTSLSLLSKVLPSKQNSYGICLHPSSIIIFKTITKTSYRSSSNAQNAWDAWKKREHTSQQRLFDQPKVKEFEAQQTSA
jgi:hypothetical protein